MSRFAAPKRSGNVEYIKRNRMRTCPLCSGEVLHETCQCIIDGTTGQDTDFCPNFASADLLRSYVVSCSHCGFSAYPSDFGTPFTAAERRELARVLEETRRREGGCRLCLQNPYLLAASCYEWLGRGDHFLGWICHRGAWWCRSRCDVAGERRFQLRALEHFERSLKLGSYPRLADVPVLTYLVGELHRRLGRISEAKEWFGQVADVVVDPEEHAWLLDLTRQQREINDTCIN